MAAGLPDLAIAGPAIGADGEADHDPSACVGVPDGTGNIPAGHRAGQMAGTRDNAAAAGAIAAASASGSGTLSTGASPRTGLVRSPCARVISGSGDRRDHHRCFYRQLDFRRRQHNLAWLGPKIFRRSSAFLGFGRLLVRGRLGRLRRADLDQLESRIDALGNIHAHAADQQITNRDMDGDHRRQRLGTILPAAIISVSHAAHIAGTD